MDQFKELRAHPKMTKALLEQIESLQKENHTTDEISATLGITPESVQRGYEKLNDKHRAESSCPWRGSNREYCVWPSCFKHSISTVRTDVNEDEDEADTTLNEEESANG